MNLTDHLRQVKTLIEALPSNPSVKIFAGKLDEEGIKGLAFDGKRPYVLLSGIGGSVPDRTERLGLELDSVFAAFIVAKADQETIGYSSVASDTAVEIAKLIDKYRGDKKTNVKLPMLQSVEELFSGSKGGTNYSGWSVSWIQRISLV